MVLFLVFFILFCFWVFLFCFVSSLDDGGSVSTRSIAAEVALAELVVKNVRVVRASASKPELRFKVPVFLPLELLGKETVYVLLSALVKLGLETTDELFFV